MRIVHTSQTINIPEGANVTIKGREVTVTGPRGKLVRDFNHLQVDIKKVGKDKIIVEVWWGTSLHNSAVRTVCSHIQNLITGVMKGYQYNMRLVYAHFPINTAIVDNGKALEIRNFLGQKRVRRVEMADGVTISRSESAKDQLELVGNDIESVSQSAANIRTATIVKNKDIRKFLDGIFVSEKGVIGDLVSVV